MTGLEPPFYAVIFSSRRADRSDEYSEMAERMERLAARQPGFLGMETVRGEDGFGITVSYWRNSEDIVRWKQHAEHVVARRLGNQRFYEAYSVRVARVERAYEGPSRAPADECE